ncbi:unnamed protein product [Calypogeia fissa]
MRRVHGGHVMNSIAAFQGPNPLTGFILPLLPNELSPLSETPRIYGPKCVPELTWPRLFFVASPGHVSAAVAHG